MSDDEKLAAPSFESMDAGCVFGDAATVFDPTQVVAAPLEYQHHRLERAGRHPQPMRHASPPPPPRHAARLHAERRQLFARAAAPRRRAPVRRVGRARFRNDAVAAGGRRLRRTRWTIVPIADGAAAPVDPERAHLERVPGRARDRSTAAARAGRSCPAHELEA